jgi:hypothetical protein
VEQSDATGSAPLHSAARLVLSILESGLPKAGARDWQQMGEGGHFRGRCRRIAVCVAQFYKGRPRMSS